MACTSWIPLAGLTACALAACGSRGSEAAEYRADTTGRRDSVAAVAAASMSEGAVIGMLEQTHAADSALGALGASKGSVSEVKDFGRMIMREHRALRKDAGDLARKTGIVSESPRVPPDEPPTIIRDSLNAGTPGAAWDRTYLSYAIAMHESAMENSARALAATRQPDVKEFIVKSVPILQKHLDKARHLRRAAKAPAG
jgi:putative membrane protein